MFVRKLKSNSGKIYVQIIDKTTGKYRVVKNIGSSYSNSEIKRLEEKARIWIDNKLGVQRFDFEGLDQQAARFLKNITGLKLVGLDLLLVSYQQYSCYFWQNFNNSKLGLREIL